MTSREFCYWLQGMFELSAAGDGSVKAGKVFFDSAQTSCIRKHLAMVFKHEIDPSYPESEELDKLHNPPNSDPFSLIVRC